MQIIIKKATAKAINSISTKVELEILLPFILFPVRAGEKKESSAQKTLLTFYKKIIFYKEKNKKH
jgi:hypothetical protein